MKVCIFLIYYLPEPKYFNDLWRNEYAFIMFISLLIL